MMKVADKFNFDKFMEYRAFIQECSEKSYDESLILHNHHIIPKHMCMDGQLTNSSKNLIKLSVEDHIKAHLMLSDMYEQGTYEYVSNLRAVRILSRKMSLGTNVDFKIKESYRGINNFFYGRKHTEETRKILSEKSSLRRKGKSYVEIYGSVERAEEEKKKRAKKTRTDEQYLESGRKASFTRKKNYATNPNTYSQPYLVDGMYFISRKKVLEYFGKSLTTIQKYHNVQKLEKSKK